MPTHETTSMYPRLDQFMLFRLDEINFIVEIREREIMSKTLSKYIAALDHLDKSLLVLSATIDGISVGAPIRIIFRRSS